MYPLGEIEIKPSQFSVTLTVYSISAAVFNLDDMFPSNLQVEVQNGVLQQSPDAPPEDQDRKGYLSSSAMLSKRLSGLKGTAKILSPVTAIIWVNTKTAAAITHVITTATVTMAVAYEPAITAVAAVVAIITVTSAPFGICNRVMENIS